MQLDINNGLIIIFGQIYNNDHYGIIVVPIHLAYTSAVIISNYGSTAGEVVYKYRAPLCAYMDGKLFFTKEACWATYLIVGY